MKSIYKYLFSLVVSLAVSIQANSQTVIQMEKDGGVYKIPCEINGLRLKLIFDTGASNVCISESIALMMLENDYLEKTDIRGTGSSVVADGRIVDNTKINIRSLKIGEVTLNNVEAVVIHQQSAPLLLGQSAIRKLGNVSINGNLLILNQHANANNQTSDREGIVYKEILAKAEGAYSNKFYELALSYYNECYGYIDFDSNAKYKYANCFYQIGEYNRALALFNEIIQDSAISSTLQMSLLRDIMRCYYQIGDYNSCVLIGQKALLQYRYDVNLTLRTKLVYCLALAYKEKSGKAYAKEFMMDEITGYLRYKNMSATDCWNRGYRDSYIAALYSFIAFSIITSEDIYEAKKYAIIAAAWGEKGSINYCNKYSLIYQRKPGEYNY